MEHLRLLEVIIVKAAHGKYTPYPPLTLALSLLVDLIKFS